MALKSLNRLLSSKLLNYRFDNRLFATSCEVRQQNEELNDLRSNPKIEKIVSMLSEYDLSEKQINSIIKRIGNYLVNENQLNANVIRETIDCWKTSVKPPKLRANQLDKIMAEDIDYDMTVDFNTVVSKIEPQLLLMNSNAITQRINYIKDLGITGGSRDLWRVFVYAPKAYYMQSWTDFLKKYHYLNYRVLEWLLDKKDKNNLHPHPLIRNAKVMELPFDTIRCRYLFAQRTGLKTVSVVNKLSNIENIKKIDLRALMLTPIDKYLKLIAPNCTIEEYNAFETLLNEREPEEDEQIIEDIVELTFTNRFSHSNKSNKKQFNENLETNYQIISPMN
jgi:hypothetical protein